MPDKYLLLTENIPDLSFKSLKYLNGNLYSGYVKDNIPNGEGKLYLHYGAYGSLKHPSLLYGLFYDGQIQFGHLVYF